MLEISIDQIRQQIQVYPQSWIHLFETNCYAYALGLDIKQKQICPGAYAPGTISQTNEIFFQTKFSYDNLIDGIESDFNLLGIDYREGLPDEKIPNDMWKVALFVRYEKVLNISTWAFENTNLLTDYHFIRANSNNIWTYKNGFSGHIERTKEPIHSNFHYDDYEYQKCYILRLDKR